MSQKRGYILLHRKLLSSRTFQNDGLLKVWIWCLLKANHETKWIQIKIGKGISEVQINPGQFIFGRISASKKLRMKPSTVWKRIVKLKNMGNLNIQSNTHYSIISIVNWHTYQIVNKKRNSQSNSQGTAGEHKQECKEVKDTLLAKEEANPDVRTFILEWIEIWSQKFGKPYTPNWAKEGKLVKGMLKIHSFQQLKELRAEFFKSEDSFIQNSDYSIGVFKMQVNKLIASRKLDPVEQAREEMRNDPRE